MVGVSVTAADVLQSSFDLPPEIVTIHVSHLDVSFLGLTYLLYHSRPLLTVVQQKGIKYLKIYIPKVGHTFELFALYTFRLEKGSGIQSTEWVVNSRLQNCLGQLPHEAPTTTPKAILPDNG